MSPIRCCRGAAAPGRFPDHPGLGAAPRREPGDHGLLGGPAARAAVRADPRRHARSPRPARSASTSITVQFDLTRNIDAAANDIQAAINAAGGQLPTDLPSPPTYRKVNPADSPILLLSAMSDTMPLTEVDDLVDIQLAQQISQISGVAQVSIGGEQKPAIRVQIDPARSWWRRTCLSRTSAPSCRSPRSTTRKAVSTALTRSYTVYANDQLTAAKDWNNVILAYRDGAPLRIRDVGTAIAGPEDTKQAAWANGKRGVFLIVFKQPGANVIDHGRQHPEGRCRGSPPRCRRRIQVAILSDRTQTIRASVRDVQFTLLITIALVVAGDLRLPAQRLGHHHPEPRRAAGAARRLRPHVAAGYTLDNLSLMAMTISVGFVVDDAIVMLENITRYVEAGMKPLQAALKGAGEIGFTIISISISLIAVLIPLLLMSGIIGRLFREFAVVLSMTIAVSAFVSLTLTPVMAPASCVRMPTPAMAGSIS